MPVVPDEVHHYGYVGENRHMVQSFRAGVMPMSTFVDGVAVTDLLMALVDKSMVATDALPETAERPTISATMIELPGT